MIKKLLIFAGYSLKYELKRTFIVLLLILAFGISTHYGLTDRLETEFTSVNVIDEDKSNLSNKFIFYLESINITFNQNAPNTIKIPSGFEKDFMERNATLGTGLLGPDTSEAYDFQLYLLGESNRINTTSNISDGGILIVILIITLSISSFLNSVQDYRISNRIYFFNNHLPFWYYILIGNIITFFFIAILAIIGVFSIQDILLLFILIFLLILVVYYQRNNIKLISNISYFVYGIGFLLVLAQIQGLNNYPVLDLLFEEVSPMLFIDLTILVVLVILVARLKFTE